MNTGAAETYTILACSWHRAQRRPSDRFKIGPVVMEESAIEFWDCQYPLSAFPGPPARVDSDFMSIDAPETYLIPGCSWRRAQRCPSDRSKVGPLVVEQSAIKFCDRQHPLLAFPGPPPD